mmetsp:Transcript_168860/g.542751  ORF Transcript_168860/g.542751 Transcript_168860/m.542751 type:complete len:636 (-) Transcript_168860:218-2125(-)
MRHRASSRWSRRQSLLPRRQASSLGLRLTLAAAVAAAFAAFGSTAFLVAHGWLGSTASGATGVEAPSQALRLDSARVQGGRRGTLGVQDHTVAQRAHLADSLRSSGANAVTAASGTPTAVTHRSLRRTSFGLWAATIGARAWSRRATSAMMRRASSIDPIQPLGACPPPILYQQRWVQLALLAMLALLSDWVCFSVAATPSTWVKVFGQDPATLIDIFLFTNVGACLLEPFIIKKFGLRIPIVGAAALMAIGCLLRSGIPFVGDTLPSYDVVVAGTMMVAVAQPFFQCTPPLLSATWFAADERSLATAVAINFNQVGIATAFIFGGELARTPDGLKFYFSLMALSAAVVLVATAVGFREKPPTPPSASEAEKELQGEENDQNFPEQAVTLLQTPGFLQPLAAFVVSIAVTNVVGAFLEAKLEKVGIVDQTAIDFSGAGFELAIVIGGILIGSYVDRSKEYKTTTMACLAGTFVAVSLLGLGHAPQAVIIIALLLVGLVAGPVQPINAELAVEVTYPADENAIEAVQQLCGNLISALLVPLCEWAMRYEWSFPAPWAPAGTDSITGDTAVLLACIGGVSLFFLTFNAPLRRTEVDRENCIASDLMIDSGEEEGAFLAVATAAVNGEPRETETTPRR